MIEEETEEEAEEDLFEQLREYLTWASPHYRSEMKRLAEQMIAEIDAAPLPKSTTN